MDIKTLSGLSKTFGSTYYIFHPDRFVENIKKLHQSINIYYPKTQLAYAFKANYMPAIGDLLMQHGFLGEVVSGMEYEIARMHLPASQIIFNGPCKTESELRLSLKEGAVVNLDSFREIQILEGMSNDFDEISIGLRVNFDIGTGPSRFGFNFENGDFLSAVKRLKKIGNVKLISIHSHFTTLERSLALFERRLRGMFRVFDSLSNPELIEQFNIGGGLFGPLSEKAKQRYTFIPPSFEEYAQAIGMIMFERFGADKKKPCLILEPGVSIVANTMDYVVRVLDERTSQNMRYLTVEGSINSLFPTGSRFEPDYSELCMGSSESRRCSVVGYTCMEHDIMLSDVDSRAKAGDYFVFHNRGAYSNVYKPPFIKAAPPIVGLDGQIYAKPQTAKEVVAPYNSGYSS